MLDLNKEKITIECHCGRSHSATLQDTINGKIISCHCGAKIRLQNDGSLEKGVNEINKAFRDLGNIFKKIGR
jgi:hypothetical protein